MAPPARRASRPHRDADAEGLLRQLGALRAGGGPLPASYPRLHAIFDRVAELRASGRINATAHRRLVCAAGPGPDPTGLIGHIYSRPHGIAGDWKLLEKLHTGETPTDSAVAPWDTFVQSLPAAHAVRERSEVLLRLASPHRTRLRLLSVGCGPGRDLERLLAVSCPRQLELHVLDVCEGALDATRRLAMRWGHEAHAHLGNALRMPLPGTFDLIWSAGLFDYLPNTLFVRLARRLTKALTPNGSLVVGNFADTTPHKSAMAFVDWELIYRSADQLRHLLLLAAPRLRVAMQTDSHGINLFAQAIKERD